MVKPAIGKWRRICNHGPAQQTIDCLVHSPMLQLCSTARFGLIAHARPNAEVCSRILLVSADPNLAARLETPLTVPVFQTPRVKT
jgi:hypothetical protein